MAKQNQCIDFYGEKLKVGDKVIPILDEALIIGIGGIISKIEYSERYNNYYITITDNEGNVLLENVDAICYTTQARYDERENQEYVYRLTFYNEILWPITSIPLTNRTNADYEIPNGTCYAALGAKHLQEKGKQLSEHSWSCPSYILPDIYYFIVADKLQLCHDEKDDYYFLINPEVGYYQVVGYKDKTFRVFQNDEELKKYVKNIIEYFNSADLTYVNNDEEFEKNENGKEFEKKLIHHLSH